MVQPDAQHNAEQMYEQQRIQKALGDAKSLAADWAYIKVSVAIFFWKISRFFRMF